MMEDGKAAGHLQTPVDLRDFGLDMAVNRRTSS